MGWHAVATHLGRPPMLAYAGQVMYNWRRFDPDGPVAVGNLTMIQNFLGGMDEEWFATVHINIEAEAGRGLRALAPAQEAVIRNDPEALLFCFQEIAASLQTIHNILLRMPERCEPNTYYHRVRPYMFGWKDNPDLPDGMVYEGVDAYAAGDYATAIDRFATVAGAAASTDERRLRARKATQRAFEARGVEHLEAGRVKDADSDLAQAASIAAEVQDPGAQARATLQRAQIALDAGHPERAADYRFMAQLYPELAALAARHA